MKTFGAVKVNVGRINVQGMSNTNGVKKCILRLPDICSKHDPVLEEDDVINLIKTLQEFIQWDG
jgi:hypothetical protein